MSADNLYRIRRAGKRYLVHMEFLSNDEFMGEEGSLDERVFNLTSAPPIDSDRVRWFDTLAEARAWARGEWSEYGVIEDIKEDSSWDTASGRRDRINAEFVAAGVGEIDYAGGIDGEVELEFGGCSVVVRAGGSGVVTPQMIADWLLANQPNNFDGAG